MPVWSSWKTMASSSWATELPRGTEGWSRRRFGRPSAAVEVEDDVDRAAADDAKRDVVAREHDAVCFRTIVAARLVVRPLERADTVGVRAVAEQPRVVLLL